MNRKTSIVMIFLIASALFGIALRGERHSGRRDATEHSASPSHVPRFAFMTSLFGSAQEEAALLLAGGIFLVLSLFPRKRMRRTERDVSSQPLGASVEMAQSPRLS